MSKRTLYPLAATSAVLTFAGLAMFVGPGADLRLPSAEASPFPLATPLAQGSLPQRAPATAGDPAGKPAGAPSAAPARERAPASASASASAKSEARPPLQGGVFYPDRATPYFQHRTTAGLRAALAAGDYPAALTAAETALALQAPHPERVSFVLAWLLHERRRFAEAAPLFEGLRRPYPRLAGTAAYFAARSYYHLGLHDRALALVARVPRDEAVRPRALLLEGDLHRARAAWPAAARAYAAFLTQHRGHHGTPEARVRLAEVLGASPKPAPAARRRIVELLRAVTLEAPGSVWARKAAAQLPGALAALSDPRDRRRLARLGCADELVRARAFLAQGKLRRSAGSLAAAPRLGPCPAPALCDVAARLGRRQARRKASRRAALATLALARKRCRGPAQANLWVKATYSLARAQAALGRPAAAAALYRALEARYPRHSYADDARYQRAELLRKGGRAAQADRLLRSLPKRYPKGDMSHAALWRLGWEAVERSDFKAALALLTQAAALPGAPDRVEDAGRAAYWRARVLGRLARPGEALAAYAALARKHPLTWYALLALNRLQERSPETARRILASWQPTDAPAPWRFGPAPLYGRPGFARAVELARLGLGELAAGELHRLGLASPVKVLGEAGPAGAPATAAGGSRSQRAARREALWAAVVLYDRAGLVHKSHWIVRHALRAHEERPPTGTDRARWRVGFPEAYAALVRPNARANQLPRALVWGLMREESAFNPRLVSHAGAVGLMQLLEPTARRFRAGPRGPITRATLKLPPRNVPIGTKYLGWLLRLFHGQLVLAVAAYNAGETKVFSWARERGHLPVDHFVEAIPFRETRHYVKRVLGSAFAYAVLEPAPSPLLRVPEVFPPNLVVKARGWQRLAQRWARAKRATRPRRARARPRDRRARPQPRARPRGLHPRPQPRARPRGLRPRSRPRAQPRPRP